MFRNTTIISMELVIYFIKGKVLPVLKYVNTIP
jgi:hypothetical protein